MNIREHINKLNKRPYNGYLDIGIVGSEVDKKGIKLIQLKTKCIKKSFTIIEI